MGKRGPARKSQAQVALSGDAGKRTVARRKVRAAAAVPAGIPNEPAYKWWTADHRRCWRKTTAALKNRGTMTAADFVILEAYCNAYAVWCRANRAMKGPLTFTTSTGYEANRPELGIMTKAEERMVKFAAKLGLTPTDRESAAEGFTEPEDDSFEKFTNFDRTKVVEF